MLAHATTAQILHMAGMGEYIENILRERQPIRCFALGGTSNVASLSTVSKVALGNPISGW